MVVLTAFRVQISNIQGIIHEKNAKEGEEAKKVANNVYAKFNFDEGHTVFQTDYGKKRENKSMERVVEWTTTKSFLYRTKHGDKLQNKSLQVECWRHNLLFGDKKIGSARVNLHDLATGSTIVDLTLRNTDESPIGHISFSIVLDCIADSLSLNISNAKLVSEALALPKASFVTVHHSQNAKRKAQSRPHVQECPPGGELSWQDFTILHFDEMCCSHILQDFLTFEIQTGKELHGHATIPIRDVFSISSKPMEFLGSVTNTEGEVVALLSGTVVFSGQPRYSQLVGGVTTSVGVLPETERFPSCGPIMRVFAGAPLPESLLDVDVPVAPPERNFKGAATRTGVLGSVLVAKVKLTQHASSSTTADAQPAASTQGELEQESGRTVDVSTFEAQATEELIKQLQREHEKRFAGLQQKYEEKRNELRIRLEQRKLRVKQNQDRRKALGYRVSEDASSPPVVGSAEHPVIIKPAEDVSSGYVSDRALAATVPKPCLDIFQKAEGEMYQKLMGKPPSRFRLDKGGAFAVPLPVGWQHRVSEDGSKCFAFSLHGKLFTTWFDPRAVPRGWSMQVNERGEVVFIDPVTGLGTTADPRGVPEGWIPFLDFDLQKLMYAFGNQVTDIDPRGLPPGFRSCMDPAGRLVFLNESTQLVSFEDPRKMEGVTEEVRKLWRDMEFLVWLDEQTDAIRTEELSELEKLYQSSKAELEEWIRSQEKVASAALLDFQLQLLTEGNSKRELELLHQEILVGKFTTILHNLREGWEEERKKLESEFLEAVTNLHT